MSHQWSWVTWELGTHQSPTGPSFCRVSFDSNSHPNSDMAQWHAWSVWVMYSVHTVNKWNIGVFLASFSVNSCHQQWTRGRRKKQRQRLIPPSPQLAILPLFGASEIGMPKTSKITRDTTCWKVLARSHQMLRGQIYASYAAALPGLAGCFTSLPSNERTTAEEQQTYVDSSND